MGFVQPLRFEEARKTVLSAVRGAGFVPAAELVPLGLADGRVLANEVHSDRPYPPLPRSLRDGFAVRAAEFPGRVRVVGEVRAGQVYGRALQPGEAVEIMTGAPVPEGADAVIMVEHGAVSEDGLLTTERPVASGDFVVSAGAECKEGELAFQAGVRLDYGHVGALATIGIREVPVFRQPTVSIIATGDEIVPIDERPAAHQIRNSNSHTLAAQVKRAGGAARVMPVAPDNAGATRDIIEDALTSDLLLLSGGVSAGKYDLVEGALAELGAEFFFDRVLIQPGQPLVFGRVREKFFFGLPGNPVSTMVTFELFARAALDLLAGCCSSPLPLAYARLLGVFRHRPGLTRFLPADLSGGEVRLVPWQSSGDVFGLARANAFLVAREDRESWDKGEFIEVLPR
jgi:molybdopterin molybdotransferase